MPVNAQLFLPPNVRLRTLLRVINAFYGHPFDCDTPNIKVEPLKDQDFDFLDVWVKTHIDDPSAQARPGFDRYAFLYCGSQEGENLLMRFASDKTIVLFKAIADFFGGRVDFDDSGDRPSDYVVEPKSGLKNNPDEDPEWTELEERINALQPIRGLNPRARKRPSTIEEASSEYDGEGREFSFKPGKYDPRAPRMSYSDKTERLPAGFYKNSTDGLLYGPFRTKEEVLALGTMGGLISVTSPAPVTNEELVERDILVCTLHIATHPSRPQGANHDDWDERQRRLERAIAAWDKQREGRPYAK